MGGMITTKLEMEKDRVAVIFGGVSGIGAAVARRCAKEGMKVAVADIDQAGLTKFQQEFPTALCVKCDACNEAQVKSFADQIYSQWNDVGFLFNNTGIMRGDSTYKTPLSDWKRVMDVTFFSEVIGTNEFVPRMLKQEKKNAVIVNTASIAGLVNSYRETGTPYTVAKFASRLFSEALYQELRETNIKVHCLCPGPVNTALIKNSKTQGESFAFENVQGGLSQKALEETGLSPDFVADELFKGVRANKFYILALSSGNSPAVMGEFMRLVADDVERGQGPLSYVNPTGERKKEVGKRMMDAFKRSSKL